MSRKKNKGIVMLATFITICLMLASVMTNNGQLKRELTSRDGEINSLSQRVTELTSKIEETVTLQQKNDELIKENKSLNDSIKQLTDDVNALNKTVSKAAQTGVSRPEKVGVTPQFTLSRGGFDRFRNQEILQSISEGSYQNQSQEVFFDIDDRNDWKSLGIWKMSQYTATVGECDANPSITASGKLVTPSFTVAVDPKYWKYGTIFYFQGLGFGVAADCGGGVKGKNRADYLVASKDFARSLQKTREVYLVYVPNK